AWYPASDPLVTAVGGTQGSFATYTIPFGPYAGLTIPGPYGLQNASNHYGGEEAWNEVDAGGGATGGAPSQLFPAPAYQQGVTSNAKRTVPDVALNASEFAGSEVVFMGMPRCTRSRRTSPAPSTTSPSATTSLIPASGASRQARATTSPPASARPMSPTSSATSPASRVRRRSRGSRTSTARTSS